jgi:hypothetical protein
LSTGWLTAQPVVYTVSGLPAGTYTFTLEARVPGTTDCSGSKDFVVTVSNPPAAPTVTYTQIGCQPYKIQLTASGPANGEYNWSNGMSGQTITVDEGGMYKVIYTAPSGCKVFGQLDVPLSIESLMWVFLQVATAVAEIKIVISLGQKVILIITNGKDLELVCKMEPILLLTPSTLLMQQELTSLELTKLQAECIVNIIQEH